MPEYEYLVALWPLDLNTLSPTGTAAPEMNALGAQGWELVGLLPTTRSGAPAAGFFRRPGTAAPPLLLSALVPDTAVLGSPSFTLRVLGTGFTPESVIVWNGADEVTTYVTATELTTGVNMATAEVAVTVGVEVRTGALVSNTLPFTFTPAP